MIAGIESNFLSNNKYVVRFAQSEEDVQAAQALRFKVFNVELGEGLEKSYQHQLDMDKLVSNAIIYWLFIVKQEG